MLVQALLLVAVIVLISGSILTNTVVTAKNALSHSLVVQSQAAMSDATAEFVAWAQDRVKKSNTHTSWDSKIINGRSDTNEFKRMCDQIRLRDTLEPECIHSEYLTWKVTGSTDFSLPQGLERSSNILSKAQNMSRPIDEQRIAAIISADVDSIDGRVTFASASRIITARVVDAAPYVIVTGSRELSTSIGTIGTALGDSAGEGAAYRDRPKATPDPTAPNRYTNTLITTTVDCINTPDLNPADPTSGETSGLIQEGRDGNMDWIYQSACVPAYATPPPPMDPHYIAPNGNIYATEAGNNSQVWSPIRPNLSTYPK